MPSIAAFAFAGTFLIAYCAAGVAGWEAALRRVGRGTVAGGNHPQRRRPLEPAGRPTWPDLTERLAEIPHLRRLRIHSRLPIVIPQRVTDELLDWLRGSRLTPILVVQVNHPAEIDAAVAAALGRLVDAGVPVLSQAVLLRGVNDDVETLAELYGRLVDLRVMPYYLHQLDRVAGAAHFEVSRATGIAVDRAASRPAARLRGAALRLRDAGPVEQDGAGVGGGWQIVRR